MKQQKIGSFPIFQIFVIQSQILGTKYQSCHNGKARHDQNSPAAITWHSGPHRVIIAGQIHDIFNGRIDNSKAMTRKMLKRERAILSRTSQKSVPQLSLPKPKGTCCADRLLFLKVSPLKQIPDLRRHPDFSICVCYFLVSIQLKFLPNQTFLLLLPAYSDHSRWYENHVLPKSPSPAQSCGRILSACSRALSTEMNSSPNIGVKILQHLSWLRVSSKIRQQRCPAQAYTPS